MTTPFAAAASSGVNGAATLAPEIRKAVSAVGTMYSTKDVKEQTRIIENHFHKDGVFVDPLMHVKGVRNIELQFLSLIRIFSEIVFTESNVAVSEGTKIKACDLKDGFQVVVTNSQLYKFARTGFFSKHLLPQEIAIEANTTLVFDRQSGRIIWHEDTWTNKKLNLPRFLKKSNGAFSCALFKMIGYGKQIDAAKKSQ